MFYSQVGTMLHKLIYICHVVLQWVNLATIALLLFAPGNRQLETAVYALADGPLAAALIVWQSAWVLGSPSHVIRCMSCRHPPLCRLCRYSESW